MSLSRELIVAAKARADAATEAFNTQVLEVALIGDGAPGNGMDVRYGFEFDGGRAVYDFVETAAREDVPVMADALLRVLDLHRQEPWIDADQFGHDRVRGVYCDECSQSWPCATVRAVTGGSDGS